MNRMINRKCVTLGVSILRLRSFTPSSDLLPEGYDPLYGACHERGGRDNLSQVQ